MNSNKIITKEDIIKNQREIDKKTKNIKQNRKNIKIIPLKQKDSKKIKT